MSDLCSVLSKLSVKAKKHGVNCNKDAPTLQESLFDGEAKCTQVELSFVATNWVDVEEDRDIIEAQVEEVFEELDKKKQTKLETEDVETDNDDDDQLKDNNSGKVPTFFEAQAGMEVARNFCVHIGLAEEEITSFDRISNATRKKLGEKDQGAAKSQRFLSWSPKREQKRQPGEEERGRQGNGNGFVNLQWSRWWG